MPLFEVAILEKPTPRDEKKGKLERIVMKPTYIIANDSKSAAYGVVMDAGKIDIDKARMEVLVRPFG